LWAKKSKNYFLVVVNRMVHLCLCSVKKTKFVFSCVAKIIWLRGHWYSRITCWLLIFRSFSYFLLHNDMVDLIKLWCILNGKCQCRKNPFIKYYITSQYIIKVFNKNHYIKQQKKLVKMKLFVIDENAQKLNSFSWCFKLVSKMGF